MKKKVLLLLTTICLSAFAVGLFGCGHTHSFSDRTIAPTCTEQGYDSHTCECEYYYIDNFTDAIGHAFGEYVYNQDATCTSDGTKTARCIHSGCNVTDTVTAEGTKTEHALEFSEVVIDKSEHDIDRCGKFVCKDCGAVEYKTVTYQDIGIPIVNIDGDLSACTKEITTSVTFSFEGEKTFESIAGTVKWQGATSSYLYPEKNYTLKLDSKIKVVDEWGKQKKYCLKANYVDFSQAKNVVSAKLYGEVVKSRDIEDEISGLVNGGAIDGFACVVYNNGEFLGIYTFNIPKDKWLFDMKTSDEKNQAIVQAQDATESTMLKEAMADDFSNGWDLEFYSNEDSKVDNSSSWIVEKFNLFIDFLNNNNGEDFKAGIGNYINLERCIDVLIYTAVIQGTDNAINNILWITYDGGNTWQPSVYDLDSTWGGYAWGNKILFDGAAAFDLSYEIGNLLFKRLLQNYRTEIAERYKELRRDILSNENIINAFESFYATIPQAYYDADALKWPNKPNMETNNIAAIKIFLNAHLSQMDTVLK